MFLQVSDGWSSQLVNSNHAPGSSSPRHRSGVWHFRLIVPRDLQTIIGLKVIKKSLITRNLTEAKAWGYALGARYAQVSGRARESDVPIPDKGVTSTIANSSGTDRPADIDAEADTVKTVTLKCGSLGAGPVTCPSGSGGAYFSCQSFLASGVCERSTINFQGALTWIGGGRGELHLCITGIRSGHGEASS